MAEAVIVVSALTHIQPAIDREGRARGAEGDGWLGGRGSLRDTYFLIHVLVLTSTVTWPVNTMINRPLKRSVLKCEFVF